MVSALAVALLMDRTFLYESWADVLRSRRWVYLPPIVLGCFAAALLLPGLMRGESNVGFGGYAPPVPLHLAAQAEMVWRYLSLSVWPSSLSIDYGLHAPESVISQAVWICMTLALIVIAIGMFHIQYRVAGFCILAPLLVLSVTSSFIPTADLLVEHRMYVPLAAVASGIVLLFEQALLRTSASEQCKVVWPDDGVSSDHVGYSNLYSCRRLRLWCCALGKCCRAIA